MDKKIRVLFILAQMVGGGAERVTINMMRILDRKRFDIHLVMMSKEGPSFQYLPDDIVVHDLNVTKTIFSISKLRRVVSTLHPDIIFSTLFRTHKALFFALLGIKNRPVVVMRSQNSPKLLIKNKKMSQISKYLLELAYDSADIVIAQTPEMRDELIEFHDVKRDSIHVFLNPLDTDDIDTKVQGIRNPFNSNVVNVVAAGRLAWQKGFDVLIESFRQIVEKDHNYVLHIIGEDLGEKDRLESLVEQYALNKNIHFLGYQKNPYKYYYFSDLFVLSSRWEGMPNAVLENLYLKKPVVATRCIPYMSKLIHNGENGLLVDVEDSDDLAQAIIRFREIDPNSKPALDSKDQVDQLFEQLATMSLHHSS